MQRINPGQLAPPPPAATGVPHSRQNFAPLGSSVRHWAQVTWKEAPHSRQNLAWSGLTWPQAEQFTGGILPRRAEISARNLWAKTEEAEERRMPSRWAGLG